VPIAAILAVDGAHGEVGPAVRRVLGDVLARLAESFVPPGDSALRGLEIDLSRVATLDQGWLRLCDTAWALGFVELRLVPVPDACGLLAERHAFAPRPWPMLDRSDGVSTAQSTWAFGLTLAGRPLATVTARRRLGRVDFEPLGFVAAMQGLVDQFVTAPGASPEGRMVAPEPAIPESSLSPS
jgi:hypothetical protein